MNIKTTEDKFNDLKRRLSVLNYKTVTEENLGQFIDQDTYGNVLETTMKIVGETWLQYKYPYLYNKYEEPDGWEDEVTSEGKKVDYKVYPDILIEMKSFTTNINMKLFYRDTKNSYFGELISRDKLSGSLKETIDDQYENTNSKLKVIYFSLTREGIKMVKSNNPIEELLNLLIDMMILTKPIQDFNIYSRFHIRPKMQTDLTTRAEQWADERLNIRDFQTIEEIIEELKDPEVVQLMEKWGNHKFLATKDSDKIIDTNRVINVNENNPFSKEGSYHLSRDKIGRKAPFLSLLPLEKQPVFLEIDTGINDPYFNLLEDIDSMLDRNKEKIKEIKDILKDIALVKSTNVTKDQVDDLIKKWEADAITGLLRKNRKQAISDLNDGLLTGEISEKKYLKDKSKILDKTNQILEILLLKQEIIIKGMRDSDYKDEELKWTTKGNVGIKTNNRLHKEGMVKSKGKVRSEGWIKTKSELGVKDYMKEFEDYYNMMDIKKSYDPWEMDRASLKGAYFTNPSLQNIVDTLETKGKTLTDEVLNCSLAAKMGRQATMINSIKASVPISSTKKDVGETIFTGVCPHTNIRWITTPAVKKTTGGACVLFGKWEGRIVINNWENIGAYYYKGNYTYIRTKPMRLNWAWTNSSLSMYAGLVITMVYGLSIGQRMHKSPLIWSLLGSTTRSNKKALDLSYLMDHNVFYKGTYGKDKMSEKINPKEVSGCLLSSTLFRYKEGYRRWHNTIYSATNARKERFEGLIHPVWKVETENIYQIMNLSYLKQLLPVDDGANTTSRLYEYLTKELKLEAEIHTSPFRAASFKMDSRMTIKEFYKTIIKEKDTGEVDWLTYAYHPATCYRIWEKMCDDTISYRKSVGKTGPIELGRNNALETEMPTSSMTTWNLDSFYGIKPKKKTEKEEKAKSLNIGITTMPTTEALVLEESKYNNTNIKMTMKDMVKKQMEVYPDNVIVTMRDKQQHDFDGRAFFIQMIDARVLNKELDSMFQWFLEASKYDILRLAGLEKNKLIQEHIDKVYAKLAGKPYLPCSTTEDQTRFGDKYSVEAMIIALHVMKNKGLITIEDFCIAREGLEKLRNRIVLIPPELRKLLNSSPDPDSELSKKIESLKMLIKANRAVSTVNLDKIKELEGFKDIMEDTLCFFRIYGGVLGVFNRFWSVFSGGIKETIELVMRSITNTEETFTAETHSDDSSNHSIFPCIRRNLFKPGNFSATIAMRMLKAEESLQGSKVWIYETTGGKSGEHMIGIRSDLASKKTNIPYEVLTKIFLLYSVMLPRPFSQTPSEAKCSNGFTAEIMQQLSYMGDICIPVIRILVQLIGTNPAESYSRDIYGSLSKVYELLNHGVNEVVCHEAMIHINYWMKRRYGMDIKAADVNLPTEIGGIAYSIPTLMLKTGIRANRGRLLENSTQIPKLKRLLMLMTDTSEVWKIEGRTSNYSSVDGFIVEEDSSGAPEIWKDLLINWSSSHKATVGLQKIVECSEDLERRVLPEDEVAKLNNIRSSDVKTDSMKELVSAVGDIKSPSALLHMSRIIERYKKPSFISAYRKLDTSSLIASKLGWSNRQMSNPFNKIIRKDFNIDIPTMTISEVIRALLLMAESNFDIPTICHKSYNLMKDKYIEQIREIKPDRISFRLSEDKENRFAGIKLKYETFKEGYKGVHTTNRLIESAYQSILLDRMPGDIRKSLKTYLMFSESDETGWQGYKDMILTMLEALNLKSNKDVIRNKKLIIALIIDQYREPIAKLLGDDPLSRFETSFEYGKSFTRIETSVLSKLEEVEDTIEFRRTLNEKISGIITSTLIVSDIMTLENTNAITDIQVYEASKPKVINIDEMLQDQLTQPIPRKREKAWASDLLTLLLYKNKYSKNFLTSSLIKTRESTTASISISNWRRVQLEKTGDNYFMIVEGIGITPYGITTASYLSKMLCLLSCAFITGGIKSKITELSLPRDQLHQGILTYGVIWGEDEIRYSKQLPKVGRVLNVSFNTDCNFENTGINYYSKIKYIMNKGLINEYNYSVSPWRLNIEDTLYEAKISFDTYQTVLSSDRTNDQLRIDKWFFKDTELNTIVEVSDKEMTNLRMRLKLISHLTSYSSNLMLYNALISTEYNTNLNSERAHMISSLITIDKLPLEGRELQKNMGILDYMKMMTRKYRKVEVLIFNKNQIARNIVEPYIKWETQNQLAISGIKLGGFIEKVVESRDFSVGIPSVKEMKDKQLKFPKRSLIQMMSFLEGGRAVKNYVSGINIKIEDKTLKYIYSNCLPLCYMKTLLESSHGDYFKVYLDLIPTY